MTSLPGVTTSRLPDICLVSMPYVSLSRPSIALGLLKAILDREGIDTTVAHANLWFAESVGLNRYEQCSTISPEYLPGEWTFAAAAFPDARQRDGEYLRQIEASKQLPTRDGQPLVGELQALRAAATEFVDHAARRIIGTGARVVGCTSTFEQHVASLALLRRIRELAPDVITMMGGGNCETVMGEATHRCFPWVDYVVSGEADGLIADLCRVALRRGRAADPDDLPPGVLGPCHRDQEDGQPVRRRHVPRAMFRKLDSLPTPQFGDYFDTLATSPLRRSIRPGLPLETSRGCWWGASHQCTFCGLNGSSLSYDSKSPERVLAEVHDLEERHGISDFEVVDNILDMAYFRTVLPGLTADARSRRLFFEVKANLSRDQVAALVRAGVTWVQPGIESLHTEVLRLMNKGVRGWQNVQLLKWARELGLRVSWTVLWGFPGERDEHYQEMARWIPQLEHLQAPASPTALRYDRYSIYHQRAQQMGLLLLPIPAISYVYPLGPADLDDLSYFFTTEPGTRISSGTGNLTDRPGVRAMYDAVAHWRAAFNAQRRPVLSMLDRDDTLLVVDSRECARTMQMRLRGLARAICLACDAAPPSRRLSQIIRRDYLPGVPDEEVTVAVRELVANRLILPLDGRLVGLAVRGNMPEPPADTQFPGGHVYPRPVSDAAGPAQRGRTTVAAR